MPKRPEIPSGANLEQIKIVVNALYLCLEHAVDHIKRIEGAFPSIEFKENMLNAVRNGNIRRCQAFQALIPACATA